MAKVTIYHDTRSGAGEFPLKLRITHKEKAVHINLGIKVPAEHWDKKEGKVVDDINAKTYNDLIKSRKTMADATILKLSLKYNLDNFSANELKKIVENDGEVQEESKDDIGAFVRTYTLCIETKKKDSTRSSYEQALVSLRKFDPLIDQRRFEDIDVRYLENYDKWMEDQGIRRNSRNVYFRNIRAVFNRAIDDDIAHVYPFRKFKLKKTPTRKRSLTVDELKILRDYPCEDWQKKYVDIFFLMFYLIGINGADLFPAKNTQVVNGRLEYERAKTYKAYSIKIEPEAQKIIDRYKGKDHLLSFMDDRKEGYQWLLQRMTKALKTIGPYERKGRGGKKTHTPLFPELSQYWCRHTWATIAAELDIPKETIAAALGHDMGNTTTAIYINFNQKKVDEANRKVIDYINKI